MVSHLIMYALKILNSWPDNFLLVLLQARAGISRFCDYLLHLFVVTIIDNLTEIM